MNSGPIPSPIREHSRAGEQLREPLREPLQPDIPDALRLVDDGRQRARTGSAANDPFNIEDIYAVYAPTKGDPNKGNIANEIDFNWKRYEVAGKQDFSEYRAYQEQGWRPVDYANFPGRFAPPGANGPVIVKDMILMHRPMRLTVQARNEEMQEATRAMMVHRRKIRQTPDGSAERVVYADRTSREAIEIPD